MKTIKELLEFGIINVDKPSGMTSFQVDDYVRGRLEVKRAGHQGTLDPNVSGVLPVALNRACKLSKYLTGKDKSYVGVMRLHIDVDDKKLKKEMKNFVGMIKQMPPVRSAVKRVERTREVKKFDFLEKEERDVLFFAEVEAGTYIRTLINDLGKRIGGAHMLDLRRTRAGVFEEKHSITLYDFDKAVDDYKKGDEKLLRRAIIYGDEIIRQNMPTIEIKKDNLDKILRGKPIHKQDLVDDVNASKGEYIGVFCENRFIEVARVVNDGEVIAVPDFVLN